MIIEKPDAETPYSDEKAAHPRAGSSVQEREQPPPYAEASTRPTSNVDNIPSSSQINSVFRPTMQQHVNCISLLSKHNALAGSYIIDAELPGSPLAHLGKWHGRKARKHMTKHNIVPNATFQTRHGYINLDLATAGGTSVPNKAYVQVMSRHGKVNINLFALQDHKHICLEVKTRHSPIVLFVPPNFQGALQLHSKRGNVKFLPAFAQQARTVQANDDGALVLFGQGEISLAEPDSEGLDFCSLESRHGKLTVGISGVDVLETAEGKSLIKKLGAMVLGPDIMRTVDKLNDTLRDRPTVLHQ
ncbi:hypothetical protein PHLCEN_2v11664 [Hermanssonia centrifuga]|uniref:DUF7330 domain-containing protein n=1 Tax=Hermanssonia centrifuga TaxID=98765 RepID=A0A2R6NJA3_9APHY|nr:hypothetical protein PHLCEN_2v11664 [Hermanssonia centrifuga]